MSFISKSKLIGSFKKAPARPVFVVGAGGAGTHWFGHTLQTPLDITVTVEKEPAFGWVKEMALRPNTRDCLLPKLANHYRQQISV